MALRLRGPSQSIGLSFKGQALEKAELGDLSDSIAIVELGTTWGTRGRRQPLTRGAARLPVLTVQEETPCLASFHN